MQVRQDRLFNADALENIWIFMCICFQVLGLRESIANLILSLIEENGPGKTDISLVRTQ